jgi:hypothetical protein
MQANFENNEAAHEAALTESINKLDDEITQLKFSIQTCTSQIFTITNESVLVEMIRFKQLETQRLMNFEAEKRDLQSQLRVSNHIQVRIILKIEYNFILI